MTIHFQNIINICKENIGKNEAAYIDKFLIHD